MESIFLYYILASWGLTHILVSSKILEGLRNWTMIKIPFIGEMLDCYQCSSFWASMFLYFFFDSLEPLSISWNNLSIDFLIYSFIGSGVISYLSLIFSWLINAKPRDI